LPRRLFLGGIGALVRRIFLPKQRSNKARKKKSKGSRSQVCIPPKTVKINRAGENAQPEKFVPAYGNILMWKTEYALSRTVFN
jgi:hypothetical protein